MMQIDEYGIKEPDDIIWAMEKLWIGLPETEIATRLKDLAKLWDGTMDNPTRFSGMLPWVIAKLFRRLQIHEGLKVGECSMEKTNKRTAEIVEDAMSMYSQPQVDHIVRLVTEALAIASDRLSIPEAAILIHHIIDTTSLKKIEKAREEWEKEYL